MSPRALVVVLLLSAGALAGCMGGDGPDGSGSDGSGSDVTLASGTGAIAGLLVDDRFRPIHLTDDPQTEFDAAGFVLLQETGAQAQTTENGEFTFIDLEPGTYTLRVQADGHEAVPQTVSVQEGAFAETSIVARRIANEGGTIITEEFSVFSPCAVGAIGASASPDCTLDQSEETNRFSFFANYTSIGNLSYMVTEMTVNQDASAETGAYKLVIREFFEDTGGVGTYYLNDLITEGHYLKGVMQHGEIAPQDIEARNTYWNNTLAMQIALFAQGQFKEETQAAVDATCPVYEQIPDGSPVGLSCPIDSRGLGAQIGVRGQFVVSLFVGEPEVDIDSYCVLC